MSQFFSAAATRAAKQKGGLVKYRSYRKGTYQDKVSERYNHCDIYELTTFRIPLDFEKIKYYGENIGEPILTGSGQDNHIIRLSHEPFYSAQGGDHVILPLELRVRRFKFVTDADLELWEAESQEEDNVTFTGSIHGISPIREILEQTGEAGLIHEATSDRDEQIRQVAVVPIAATNTTDYEERFSVVGPCGRFECPICYGPLIHLDKPRIFLPGYPENAPEVITVRVKDAKIKKLKHLYKLAKLSEISMMLSKMMDSADTVDDSPHYYDQLQ